MTAPHVADEPMMRIVVRLQQHPIGETPFSTRVEVPFDGVATSPHWAGERRVTGIDHITVSSGGVAAIDVHTVITGDDETILYRGHGRGGPDGIREGVTFETSSDRLAWLNGAVAVGVGALDGSELRVELYALD